MIQSAKKEVFGHFIGLGLLIDLILHVVIVLNVFQGLAALPGQEGSF